LPDRLRQGTRLTERRDSRSIAGSGLANTRHGDALRRRQDIPFPDHALISSRLMSYALSGVCVHLRFPFPSLGVRGLRAEVAPGEQNKPPHLRQPARVRAPGARPVPSARTRGVARRVARPGTAVILYQPNRKWLSLCRAFHDGRRDENKQLAAHLRP
jgi:hypothetical protein